MRVSAYPAKDASTTPDATCDSWQAKTIKGARNEYAS
jgi:hypothetical protein